MMIVTAIAVFLSLNCKVITGAGDEERIQSECKEENAIAFKGTFYYNDDLFEVKKYRCYLKCLYQKWNYIDENGKINKSTIQYSIRHDRSLLAALDRCLEETANLSDVCDRVYKLNFCMNEQVITDDAEKKEKIWEECGIENDIVIKEDLYYDDPHYEEKKYRCYMTCIFKKWNYIDGDGKIDTDKFQIQSDYAKNLNGTLERCIEEVALIKDICDRVYLLNFCISEKGKPREQRIIRVREECEIENNVKVRIIAGSVTGLFYNDPLLLNKSYRCYLKCVFQKLHGIDGQGRINRKIFKDMIFRDVENLEPILDKCIEKTANFTDICDRVYVLNLCVYNQVITDDTGMPVLDECGIENGIIFLNVFRLSIEDPRFEEKRFRCYTKCFFQKFGYMDGNGNIDRNKLHYGYAHRHYINYNGTLDKCIEETAGISDICDRVYSLHFCMEEKGQTKRIIEKCEDINGVVIPNNIPGKTGLFYNDPLFQNKNYRCYLMCIFLGWGGIYNINRFNITIFKDVLFDDVENLEPIFYKCNKENADFDGDCDWAYLINLCVYTKVIADHTEKTERIQEECRIENGVVIKEGDVLNYDDPHYEEKRFRCYPMCIFQKWDGIDGDGKINRNNLQDRYKHKRFINLNGTLDRCIEETAHISDICDRAFKLNVCINEKGKPREQKVIKECEIENHVETRNITGSATGLFYNDPLYNDKKYRCHLKCVFQKWGGIDGEGEIDRKKLKDVIFEDVENLEPILNKCLEESANLTDICDKVYMLNLCVYNQVITGKTVKQVGIWEECAMENGIKLMNVNKLYYDDPRFEEKRFRCNMKCSFQKFGYIDGNGKIDRNNLQDKYENEHFINLNGTLDRCIEETARISDICDRVYLLNFCVYEQGKTKTRRIIERCEGENDVITLNNIPGKTGLDYNDPLFDDKKYRCHLKCVFQKWGGIDAEGQINRKILKDVFFEDVENLETILDVCLEEFAVVIDICNAVYVLHLCVYLQDVA